MSRLEVARSAITANKAPYARVLEHFLCDSMEHLQTELAKVEQMGGEGMMLRKAAAFHRGGRSADLLKVKSFSDDEALVVAYEEGKGKYHGMVGSLVCVAKSGSVFKVGSGLADSQRTKKTAPAIGSVITFQYFELTKDGIPRFPTFLRIRPDVEPSVFPEPSKSIAASF